MSPSKRNALWLSLWSPELDIEIRKIIGSSGVSSRCQDIEDAHCYALAKSLENIDKFDKSRNFKNWVAGIGIVYLKYKCGHDALINDILYWKKDRRDYRPLSLRKDYDVLERHKMEPVVFRVGRRHQFVKYVSLKENAKKPVASSSLFLYNLLSSLPKGKHPTRKLLRQVEGGIGKRLNEWATYSGFLELHYG